MSPLDVDKYESITLLAVQLKNDHKPNHWMVACGYVVKADGRVRNAWMGVHFQLLATLFRRITDIYLRDGGSLVQRDCCLTVLHGQKHVQSALTDIALSAEHLHSMRLVKSPTAQANDELQRQATRLHALSQALNHVHLAYTECFNKELEEGCTNPELLGANIELIDRKRLEIPSFITEDLLAPASFRATWERVSGCALQMLAKQRTARIEQVARCYADRVAQICGGSAWRDDDSALSFVQRFCDQQALTYGDCPGRSSDCLRQLKNLRSEISYRNSALDLLAWWIDQTLELHEQTCDAYFESLARYLDGRDDELKSKHPYASLWSKDVQPRKAVPQAEFRSNLVNANIYLPKIWGMYSHFLAQERLAQALAQPQPQVDLCELDRERYFPSMKALWTTKQRRALLQQHTMQLIAHRLGRHCGDSWLTRTLNEITPLAGTPSELLGHLEQRLTLAPQADPALEYNLRTLHKLILELPSYWTTLTQRHPSPELLQSWLTPGLTNHSQRLLNDYSAKRQEQDNAAMKLMQDPYGTADVSDADFTLAYGDLELPVHREYLLAWLATEHSPLTASMLVNSYRFDACSKRLGGLPDATVPMSPILLRILVCMIYNQLPDGLDTYEPQIKRMLKYLRPGQD